MKGMPHTTSIMAELQALWLGLKIALDHTLIPLEINTDSELVIKMLKHGNFHYNSIIYEYRFHLGSPAPGHSFREQNQVADLLAKEGARKEIFERIDLFGSSSSVCKRRNVGRHPRNCIYKKN